MRRPIIVALLLGTSACAQHRLVVAHPDPSGAPVAVSSSAFGLGAVQRKTVADCPTSKLDAVTVRQSFGQALATVLTLGLWSPARFDYVCSKETVATGDMND